MKQGEQYRIPTRPGMGRGLVNHDPRSKDFRAIDLVPPGAEPRTKSWRRGAAYDQGQTSQCVAYTGKGLLNTAPYSAWAPWEVRSAYDPAVFYAGAQRRDEWEGSDYDGTSGLGLCRYLRRHGFIQAFHWCFSLEEYLLTLSYVGPIGLGAMWKHPMYYPDADGFVSFSGDDAGGHEFELLGVNMEQEYVDCMNSWGSSWGVNGRFKLRFPDLGRIIDSAADGFVITA